MYRIDLILLQTAATVTASPQGHTHYGILDMAHQKLDDGAVVGSEPRAQGCRALMAL